MNRMSLFQDRDLPGRASRQRSLNQFVGFLIALRFFGLGKLIACVYLVPWIDSLMA